MRRRQYLAGLTGSFTVLTGCLGANPIGQESVNNGVQKEELEKNLREMARDIDRLVLSREQDLDSMVVDWEQQSDYPTVESALSMIHEPDRTFAVQAHDLAAHNGECTEFATANPSDFIADGRKSAVLNNTDLDDVVDISV